MHLKMKGQKLNLRFSTTKLAIIFRKIQPFQPSFNGFIQLLSIVRPVTNLFTLVSWKFCMCKPCGIAILHAVLGLTTVSF